MGKTTMAAMFRRAGIFVHDTDKTVHKLYSGKAVAPIGKIFPVAVQDGRIDRKTLVSVLSLDPSALRQIEQIIHPLVEHERAHFIHSQEQSGAKIAVVDIPLLFEIGSENTFDVIVTVTAPYTVQRERVLVRHDMTEDKFLALLTRQHPDSAKRRTSHYVIDTSFGFAWVNAEVKLLLQSLSA